MDVKDQDGIWGDDTNAAWVLWLQGVAEENNNPLLINAGSDWQTFGNTDWAKDFGYTGNIDGVLSFIEDITDGLHKEEGAKEKLKATVEKEEGSAQKAEQKANAEVKKAEETQRKEAAEDKKAEDVKMFNPLRISRNGLNASFIKLDIPAGYNNLQGKPLGYDLSAVDKFIKNFGDGDIDPVISADELKTPGNYILRVAVRNKLEKHLEANKGSTAGSQSADLLNAIPENKSGNTLPLSVGGAKLFLQVVVGADVNKKPDVVTHTAAMGVYYDIDKRRIPCAVIKNFLYTEKDGLWRSGVKGKFDRALAQELQEGSNNTLDKNLLRRLILKTLKENGEI
jgi:hypothetical protein